MPGSLNNALDWTASSHVIIEAMRGERPTTGEWHRGQVPQCFAFAYLRIAAREMAAPPYFSSQVYEAEKEIEDASHDDARRALPRLRGA